MKVQKTNAMRILDKNRIAYEVKCYPVDEDDLSAITVAHKIGFPPEQVFKTLVLRGKDVLIVVLPATMEVDLKEIASASENKSVAMVPQKELLHTTGYIRGGCTPIGMKKLFPAYFHSSILKFKQIAISAGTRGMQLLVSPNDIVALTHGKLFG